MAGVSRLQYANEIRLIRVMCTGRVDLEFILRALANGQDGVFVGGCKLGECNYVTQGNFDAWAVTFLCKKIMTHIGLNPDRLRIEFMNASDGQLLAESINAFTKQIRELGPLGQSEGLDPAGLKMKINAARKLVPYLRLVERERLRVPVKSAEEYRKFYESEEVDRLIKELVLDKLTVSEIVLLLREKALSTAEIAEALGQEPAQVGRHLNVSSRQGLIRYDEENKRYAAA